MINFNKKLVILTWIYIFNVNYDQYELKKIRKKEIWSFKYSLILEFFIENIAIVFGYCKNLLKKVNLN